MSMNYIKQYSDGTTEATLVKPSYGVVSTTGDYLIDGLWYDLTGTLYTTQFTYLSKDGKLLGIEVVDGEPVDIHYDEDAPSIVEKCVQADTLILDNQSITGVLGQGQTWQDILASRSAGVTYTNSTGRPIEVQISAVANASGQSDIRLTIDGIVVSRDAPNGSTADFGGNVCAVIPNGSTYSVTLNRMSIFAWAELR